MKNGEKAAKDLALYGVQVLVGLIGMGGMGRLIDVTGEVREWRDGADNAAVCVTLGRLRLKGYVRKGTGAAGQVWRIEEKGREAVEEWLDAALRLGQVVEGWKEKERKQEKQPWD